MIERVIWGTIEKGSLLADFWRGEAEDEGWQEATIGKADGTEGEDVSIRRSAVIWLPESHLLTHVLVGLIAKVNEAEFGFSLTRHEAVQLTRYLPGDHYRWHCDQFYPHPGQEEAPLSERTVRKLSIAVQLTHPSSYLGGDVVIQDSYGTALTGRERGEEWRALGSYLVFPSFLQHCVMPVKTGTRISAVMWATGPLWR